MAAATDRGTHRTGLGAAARKIWHSRMASGFSIALRLIDIVGARIPFRDDVV
jgi:hypothetical protein